MTYDSAKTDIWACRIDIWRIISSVTFLFHLSLFGKNMHMSYVIFFSYVTFVDSDNSYVTFGQIEQIICHFLKYWHMPICHFLKYDRWRWFRKTGFPLLRGIQCSYLILSQCTIKFFILPAFLEMRTTFRCWSQIHLSLFAICHFCMPVVEKIPVRST